MPMTVLDVIHIVIEQTDALVRVTNITIKGILKAVLNVKGAQIPNNPWSNVSLVQTSHTAVNVRLDSGEVSVRIHAADVKEDIVIKILDAIVIVLPVIL